MGFFDRYKQRHETYSRPTYLGMNPEYVDINNTATAKAMDAAKTEGLKGWGSLIRTIIAAAAGGGGAAGGISKGTGGISKGAGATGNVASIGKGGVATQNVTGSTASSAGSGMGNTMRSYLNNSNSGLEQTNSMGSFGRNFGNVVKQNWKDSYGNTSSNTKRSNETYEQWLKRTGRM